MAKKNKMLAVSVSIGVIFAFILGFLVAFLLNNFDGEGFYQGFSCKLNKHSCEAPAWDGNCTQEIIDECCEEVPEIRYCGGTTSDPMECYTQYCDSPDEDCVPGQRIDMTYECQCKNVIFT